MLPILFPPKLDIEKLVEIQQKVAKRVVAKNGFKKIKRVAGCDISFAKNDQAFGACVVMDCKTLKVLDKNVVKVKLKFPYIPTFLAFRELEGMLKAVDGLKADAYMVGAHGLAHPRRAGLACHLGVVLDRPTFGVAKSILTGTAREPANARGNYTYLLDGKEVIGAAVRTNAGSKPVYVSVGHKITLKSAIAITLQTTKRHRLPEPLLRAHRLATEEMKRVVK
ncbi:MAG: endonuclease V [Candidatus Hadarchaeales archaeon]